MSRIPVTRFRRAWHLGSAEISEIVYAEDQFAAFDSLRERPATDFGLIVKAWPNDSGDADNAFLIRTSLLMFRWGRESDALRFIARMIEFTGIDTTREDIEAVGEFQ